MEEIWKKIQGFDNYKVSNLGHVMALEKEYIDVMGRSFHVKQRLLSTKTQYRNGKIDYTKVKLVDNNGNTRNLFVHRLVADAFIPNERNCPEVNHIDLNKSNNSVNNLEWVTKIENSQRCIQRPHYGETNKNHKLNTEMVIAARNMFEAGMNYVSIAREIKNRYDVFISPEQISNVINRKQWKHI